MPTINKAAALITGGGIDGRDDGAHFRYDFARLPVTLSFTY